jgi:ABC-2 type transport system ATP-binding protein
VVRSFDGTAIVGRFDPALARGAGERVPTVLVGPGYPNAGDRRPDLNSSDRIGTARLRAAGYNVLTWDPRGLGESGGVVQFDSPSFEARDVQALIDYVAAQPEALLDGPGDPRVGMSGTSYGGAIQLVAAALDGRVDALVPDSAWHSLQTGFFPDGAAKTGWQILLCAAGELNATVGGIGGAAGIQLGSTAPEITRGCVESLTGAVSRATVQWFADRGPGALLSRVRAPTLLTHGTVDVLLPPDEASVNYQVLRANGVPVKMIWYCGGHGRCQTPDGGSSARLAQAGLAWLDRWLKRDERVDTGPAFEWLADDGTWRAAPDWPLAGGGSIDAAGSGSLVISPSDGVSSLSPGALIASPRELTFATLFATPAQNAVNVAFATAPTGSDILGTPRLRLEYAGTAVPARTWLFAQLVDRDGRVVGGQVTPIAVLLDGRTHTIERSLATIAAHTDPQSAYRLQITPATLLYGTRLAAGAVTLRRIDASLPLVASTGREPAAARRTPRRPRIAVSSRRRHHASRVVLRTTLRSHPCAGTMTFSLRTDTRPARRYRANISTSTCAATRVVIVRARAGTPVRVALRFDGNNELAPRRAHSVTHRLS